MLDINFIRKNAEIIKKTCELKRVSCDIDFLLKLDSRRKKMIQKRESLNVQKNKLNEEMQKSNDDSKSSIIERGKKTKKELEKVQSELEKIKVNYDEIIYKIPNIISPDTPIGKDESENKVIRKIGVPKTFDFQPKEHWQLGEELDVIDIQRAVKVSGSRFSYLKGATVMLEFALIQHAFSILTSEEILRKIAQKSNLNVNNKPFIPIVPPVLIKPEAMSRMSRLEPQEERYHIPIDNLYLIGSAEHTLGSMHMDETFDEKELPLRYIGFSTAFRREAGSYGKDTKGILRVHQFDKLEMESFTTPEQSTTEQDFIVAIQEYLIRSLDLPYQVIAVCTGDMGVPDYRQIDIETWLPGQNKYRETNTSDLMNDYQARRLKTRVRRKGGKKEFVHMNDATAYAIGRTIIAILENYQQANGSVKIPEVLQKYMPGNIDTIKV